MHTDLRKCRWVFLAGLLFTTPMHVWACQPVFPLVQLLGGSSLAGPILLTQSVAYLFAAVIIKTTAFALFERRLSLHAAISLMILANVLSTVPGILIAGFTGSLFGIVLAVPIVGVLGMLVGRRQRLLHTAHRTPRVTGGMAALFFVGFFIVSAALYGVARSALVNANDYAVYWVSKFVFVTIVACTGLAISAILEELVIAYFTRTSHPGEAFYKSVFRANYVTLAVILLVAAIQMLPKRLGAPGFIAAWLDSLLAAVGLA